jgi:hypothetical protein
MNQHQENEPDVFPPSTAAPRSRWSIWSLMLITTVCCFMAAAGNYLLRAIRSENLPRSKFVMFTLTAPVIALVAMSLIRWVFKALGKRR